MICTRNFISASLLLLFYASRVLSRDLNCKFKPGLSNHSNAFNKMDTLRNCDAKIMDRKIVVECSVYATTTIKLPLFPKTSAGILVTNVMESCDNVSSNVSQSTMEFCLKIVKTRIQKIDVDENLESGILNKYKKYIIPPVAFLPLMVIEKIDVWAVFDTDYAVGIARFNNNCLQRKRANYSEDISSCVRSAKVLRTFVTPGADLNFNANISIFELLEKDTLAIILMLMDQVFLIAYNGSVPCISFGAQRLKFLPTEALTLLSEKSVNSLEFSSSGISSIRNGDLPQMTTLRKLDLSDCQIEAIETEAFVGISNLQELNLQGNRLKELPLALRSLSKLQSLILRGNRGRDSHEFSYQPGVFNDYNNLRNLDLSNMVLANFWKNFRNCSHLEVLNLSHSTIEKIPDKGIASKLANLVHLNLSNNNLKELSPHVLTGLRELQELDLSFNKLAHFRYNDTVSILPKLRFISLSANRITEFLALRLGNDSVLDMLDLSYNGINSWREPKLNLAERILTVNLIENNITKVNSKMQSDFEQLKEVNLAGNAFDCESCSIRSFLKWINSTNTSMDFSNNPYTCFFPIESFKLEITEVSMTTCGPVVYDLIRNVIIPVTVVIVLISIVAGFVIIYRWHILYLIYLFRAKVYKFKRHDGNKIFKYDAFVSYCSEDRDWVLEHLIPAVENEDPKLHLCVHERDFEIGETIMNNILECIDNSHKSIFILSERFIRSQWCQWELQMAQHKLFDDRRDVLILVTLGEINDNDIPRLLRRLMTTRTYLQWLANANSHKLFWKRMKDAIGSCQCTKHNNRLDNHLID